MNHLFNFGLSYTSQYLINLLKENKEWKFSATSRTSFNHDKVECLLFDQILKLPNDITHMLISIPPNNYGDVVIQKFANHIAKLPNLKWVGYLSTTGVYGDVQGRWVSENSALKPNNSFANNRIIAETEWQELHAKFKLPLHIFRISGIYGPTRSALDKIRMGRDYVIYKKNQVFSRIHVSDIAQILKASINNLNPGSIYNMADDYPCDTVEIFEYCCNLLKMPKIKIINYEDAKLNDMEKIFYQECRRVSNAKIKNELKITLQFPTYKEGILSLI